MINNKYMNSNNYNDNNLNKISLINIYWIRLNKKGLIENPDITLNNKAAIYIYQLIHNKSNIYVGSTCNLAERIKQHRYSVKSGKKSCPKFYNFIARHGWNNFRLGILEYINTSGFNTDNKHNLKKTIEKREQYYLDMLKPNLNINKTAGSTLGYKHSEEMRKKMGLERKGKSINWIRENYFISEETRNNLSLRVNGVIVKTMDKNNSIINTFPTITSAAKFYDLDHNTISKYIKNKSWFNDVCFLAELKDVRVWVFNKEYKIVHVFTNAHKAALYCNTNHTTLGRYLKSGKLWKNKFYFSRKEKLILD